jgi:urease accessory protein
MILAPAGREARGFLESAREIQSVGAAGELRAGVTAIAGLVIARWLAADAAALRRAYADFACHLRQVAMGLPPLLPRLWHV